MRYLWVLAALVLAACSNNFDAAYEPDSALSGNFLPTERCDVYEYTTAKEQELIAAGFVRIGVANVEMPQAGPSQLKGAAADMGKNKGADIVLLQQQFLRSRTEVKTLSSTEPGKVTEYESWSHGRPYRATAYTPPKTTTAFIPTEVKDFHYTAYCYRRKSTIPAAAPVAAPVAQPAAPAQK